MKDLVSELESKRTPFQCLKRKTSYSGQYSDIKQRQYTEPAKNFNNRSYGSGKFRSTLGQTMVTLVIVELFHADARHRLRGLG